MYIYFSFSCNRNDEKARRAQKKTKDSYLNAFSNKIKQNIDKYRTELTGNENDHDSEDSPASSTVSPSCLSECFFPLFGESVSVCLSVSCLSIG